MDEFVWPVIGTVAGGVILFLFGTLWTRLRQLVRPRPEFRIQKHGSGRWELVRVRRKPVYDLTVRLSIDGRPVSPDGGEYVDQPLKRDVGVSLPTDRDWNSITVTWQETPKRVVHGWIDVDGGAVPLARPAHQPLSRTERIRQLFK